MRRTKRLLLLLTLAAFTGCAHPITPTPPPPPAVTTPPPFSPWSAPHNGIQARITTLPNNFYSARFFIEIQNTGPKPITIPTLSIFVESKDFPWRPQIAQDGIWKTIDWENLQYSSYDNANPTPRKPHKPTILQPGQTALLQLYGSTTQPLPNTGQYRMLLQQSAAGPLPGWTGNLQTPPADASGFGKSLVAHQQKLTPPTCLPPLFPWPSAAVNASGDESSFHDVRHSNFDLLVLLSIYPDASITPRLEHLLLDEDDFTVKLILAVEAASRGSFAGRDFILSATKDLEYDHCRSTLDAIATLAHAKNAPSWVCDAMLHALEDQRPLTHLPKHMTGNPPPTVSLLAASKTSFTSLLGEQKYRPALPFLLQLATRNASNQDQAISALANIGDPAAIPLLTQLVKHPPQPLHIQYGTLLPPSTTNALSALVKLKAPGITDELLAHPVHARIIELLEITGDPRALPLLRQIVASGKPPQVKGSNADSDRGCVDAAKIALATLEPGDPIPRYCQLLGDQTLDENLRLKAISRLREKNQPMDPRAVPALLHAAAHDPSYTVADSAIFSLRYSPSDAAIDGLIALFDADFQAKPSGKFSNHPETFRISIANSLEAITGQSLGNNPAAWRSWRTKKITPPSPPG